MESFVNDKNPFSNFEEEIEKVVVSLPLKSTNSSKNKKRGDNEVDMYSEDEEPEYYEDYYNFVLHPWTREWPSNTYKPPNKRARRNKVISFYSLVPSDLINSLNRMTIVVMILMEMMKNIQNLLKKVFFLCY
jgi:hypothetical protein